MAAMKLEMAQKDKTVSNLTAALKLAKEAVAAAEEEGREAVKAQLTIQVNSQGRFFNSVDLLHFFLTAHPQRCEYEGQARRQLEFVEQLVADKSALNARCEALAAEFSLLEKKVGSRQREAEERHERELKKQRESILTAEKIRRDNWMSEKSREIKEMTVKGLQPEIERLIAKHKGEVRRMEEANADEQRRHREGMQEAHERAINELRERMMAERERAVERERELASVRMRECSERFDQQLQAQRVRLAQDMSQERERLEAAHRSERQRIEEMYGVQVMDDSRKLASLQREWSEREEDLRRQHAAEMSKMRERLEIEKDEWSKMISAKLEKEYRDKEAGLQAICDKQRDEEIEVVIARLEEEAEQAREAMQFEADEREAKQALQFQDAVRDAKEAEKAATDKYLALFRQHRSVV